MFGALHLDSRVLFQDCFGLKQSMQERGKFLKSHASTSSFFPVITYKYQNLLSAGSRVKLTLSLGPFGVFSSLSVLQQEEDILAKPSTTTRD